MRNSFVLQIDIMLRPFSSVKDVTLEIRKALEWWVEVLACK
jgi:hypothetical protein